MASRLQVLLFNGDYNTPTFIEDLTPLVSDIVIRAVLHGGVESIALPLAKNYVDAYLLAYERIGYRVIIVDETLDVIAEGTVIEPSISEDGVQMNCKGPFFDLCFRQHYLDTATWISSGDNDGVIRDMLIDECPTVSSDQSNIDSPNTNIFPWQSDEYAYPGELIPMFAAMSDSQNREWYFWLRSAPLDGAFPQKPLPYFKAQNTSMVDFVTYLSHLAPGGIELALSLVGLANSVKVRYQRADGVQRITAVATDADSQSRYWLREVWNRNIGVVPLTAANQYRSMYLAKYKDPQQRASFRLNGFIYSEGGIRWPLWRVIKEFPCVVRIADLVPQEAMFDTDKLDRERTFYTLAADYSYANNVLQITPDTESESLELFLSRFRGPGG